MDFAGHRYNSAAATAQPVIIVVAKAKMPTAGNCGRAMLHDFWLTELAA